MLNPVREGEEDYIEAIRYRRRLKIFKNFFLSGDEHARRPLHKMDGVFFFFRLVGQLLEHPVWRHLLLPAH